MRGRLETAFMHSKGGCGIANGSVGKSHVISVDRHARSQELGNIRRYCILTVGRHGRLCTGQIKRGVVDIMYKVNNR